MFQFYVDFGCSFLFYIIELLYLRRNYSHSDNQTVKDTKNNRIQKIWKERIFIIRLALGLLCNAAIIISICVLKKDVCIAGNVAKGLFITIVIFTVLSFLIMEYIACGIDPNDECTLTMLIGHRIYEIQYDIVLCVYCLLLSNWVMTKLAIVINVLSTIDITISAISLIKNVCDLKNETNVLTVLFPICVFIFIPFPVVFILIMLSSMLSSGGSTSSSSHGGTFDQVI